jgi:hypothetical protein
MMCLLCVSGWVATAALGGTSSTIACPSQGMVSPAGSITVSGGVATVHFNVASGCSNVQLSLVSYTATGPTFNAGTVTQQVLYDSQTQSFSAGPGTLSIRVPNCYYQLDFVYGLPITHFTPGNLYGSQHRLIAAKNGGTTSCSTTTPTTPETPAGGSEGGTTTPVESSPAPPAPVVAIEVQKLERLAGTGSFVAGPLNVTVGQTIEYQINVKDTGNVMLWVTVSDPLCDPGTLSSQDGQGVGATGVVTFTCTHLTTAADVGTLTNTAAVHAVAGNGMATNATATAVAQVAGPAAVATTAPAAAPAGAVLGATHTLHKAKAAKKHVKAVKAAKHAKKKVTKKAKPAKAVVRSAHFTG